MRRVSVAWVLCVLAVGAAAQAPPEGLQEPSEQPVQAPRVQPEHRSQDAAQPHQSAEPKPQTSPQSPPVVPSVHPEGGHGEGQPKAQESGEEGTEFWPPIRGYRLKITDTVIAAFTALLFFATVALWWATKRLVRGADKTAERQLRAYISLDQNGFIRKNDVAWYNVGFRNFGNTPAENVRMSCESDLRIAGDNRPFPVLPLTKARGIIAPTQVSVIGTDENRAFSAEEWEDIYAGRKVLYLFGQVTYWDCFGREQTTGYRLKTTGQLDTARKGLFQMCEDGNEAT